ncbi:MAG: hypothetical protein K2I17_06175 [Clostridia bacterium]|nr:hypothetical protein [Clostridia bacterium]
MTVLNYMAMIKNKLREKHNGETYLFGRDVEAMPVQSRSAYDILGEIDAMQGLNKSERTACGYAGAGYGI